MCVIIAVFSIGVILCTPKITNTPYNIRSYPDCYEPFVKKDKDIIVRTVWKIIDSVRKNVLDSNIGQAQKYWDYTYGIDNHPNADSIWVDTLFYSTDCKKTLAFINIRKLRSLPDFSYEYKYDCKIIIGIRDSLGNPWKFYGWPRMQAVSFETAKDATNQSFRYYVDDYMRKDNALVYLPDGSTKSLKFEYNLTDSLFWDSCLLWRPNARGKGVFLFQTWSTNINENQQLPDINVELTEAEIELFRKEKTICK